LYYFHLTNHKKWTTHTLLNCTKTSPITSMLPTLLNAERMWANETDLVSIWRVDHDQQDRPCQHTTTGRPWPTRPTLSAYNDGSTMTNKTDLVSIQRRVDHDQQDRPCQHTTTGRSWQSSSVLDKHRWCCHWSQCERPRMCRRCSSTSPDDSNDSGNTTTITATNCYQNIRVHTAEMLLTSQSAQGNISFLANTAFIHLWVTNYHKHFQYRTFWLSDIVTVTVTFYYTRQMHLQIYRPHTSF